MTHIEQSVLSENKLGFWTQPASHLSHLREDDSEKGGSYDINKFTVF